MSDVDSTLVDRFAESEKKWQVRSVQIAILVTLLSLIGGGIKYLYQRGDSLQAQAETAKMQAANAKRQSQKPFLEKQQATCFETVKIVGSLAAENEPGINTEPKEHARVLNEFWIHFHGVLSVVENDKVEAGMVHLGNQLRECERNHQKCDLQNNANALAHACRDLIRAGWDITDVQYNK